MQCESREIPVRGYLVTFSTEFRVKANSETAAVEKAEDLLAEFFEHMPCGPTEIFSRRVMPLPASTDKLIGGDGK